MLGLVILQNASFTLVSRARNSSSIAYHTFASVLSNGIWLLVIRQVVLHLDNWILMVTYLVGAVIGSISMHYVAMKYFEKPKPKPLHTPEFEATVAKILKNILVRGQEFDLAAKVRDYQKSLENKDS
jgi:hypothetical protein